MSKPYDLTSNSVAGLHSIHIPIRIFPNMYVNNRVKSRKREGEREREREKKNMHGQYPRHSMYGLFTPTFG